MDIGIIIEKAKKKDPEALAAIYRMYYPKMMGTCIKIIKEDKDMASDLVHDAFILAFVSLDKLRDNERLGEWLTTIVRNVALKHNAQKSRIRIKPFSMIGAGDSAIINSSATSDALVDSRDILKLVEQLPEGYAKIFRLSVIEGFTHKEIADMLGIEPHSSSSQLSRAKKLLRRMMHYRQLAILLLFAVTISLYIIQYYHNEPKICETDNTEKEKANTPVRDRKETQPRKNDMDIKPYIPTADGSTHDARGKDTNINTSVPNITEKESLTGEIVKDSGITTFENIVMPAEMYHFAEKAKSKNRKWQFLAAGSLGPALAQNMYKLLTTSNNDNIGSEASSSPITKWEDYSKYLHSTKSGNTTTDTLFLMHIADNNSGDIIEQEQHDKPITFGISLSKSLNDRLSIETGIQYSLLNSKFTLGSNGNAIVKHQKIRYIGLPLKMSYRIMNHKQLSLYSSTGITLNLPVYGKVKTSYVMDWQKAHSDSLNTRISPSLQWSASFGVGLQYQVTPNINIYIEPTVNWFIPSGGDTRTIWTEQPLMFTSPLGVRIVW